MMKYNEYCSYREHLLKSSKTPIIDLGETNVYKYFNNLSNDVFIKELSNNKTLHRCHVLEEYLALFNLPDKLKKVTGVSSGVRESLKILYSELDDWTIPKDVYPWYKENLIQWYYEYNTLTNEPLFQDIKNGTLLITYPLKPMGRLYTKEEFNNLKKFLKRDKDNIIVVDMVYWTDVGSYPKDIMRLYDKTQQVIILHSLSKIFLLPLRLGVCILPEYLKHLKKIFQELPKNNENLIEATKNIRDPIIADTVKVIIKNNNKELMSRGILKPKTNNKYNASYFHYVSDKTPDEYFKEGYLVIPESVFGGTGNGSIISSLI